MADTPAKIDNNYKRTLIAVTDDSSADIKRLLVDPVTGRLKVSATINGEVGVTGSGTIEYLAKWSGGSVLTISSILDSGGSLSFGSVKLNPLELKSLQIFGFPNSSGTFALLSDITTQSFVVGSSGNQFNISSVGTTHTFNLPTSSASGTGQLTATDWTTFNNKLSNVSGQNHSTLANLRYDVAGHLNFQETLIFSTPLSALGTTISIPVATSSANGYLSSGDWTTFNNKVEATRTINTTAPITGGGDLSADRTFAIPVATSLANGYLSSTDWTTFNNKASSEGTVYLGGSGTVNQIAYWSGGSVLISSGSFYWNNNNLTLSGVLTPGTSSFNLGSVGSVWGTIFGTSLSITSGGTLQGTFLAGTGLTMPAFTVRGIITPANTNDLGSSGSAFGTIFTNNFQVNQQAYFDAEYSNGSVSGGATITWANGNKQFIEMNQNATLAFGTPLGPCNVILRTDQGNRTGGVATWPSNVKWSGGSALSTGSGKIDVIACYFDNSNYYCQMATNFVK